MAVTSVRTRKISEGGAVEATLNIDFTGFELFSRDIQRRSRSFRPWFENIYIPAFWAMEEKWFEQRGKLGGVVARGWRQQYTEKYAIRKALVLGKAVTFHADLMLSGRIFESLTSRTKDSLLNIHPRQITMGTQVTSRHYMGNKAGELKGPGRRGKAKGYGSFMQEGSEPFYPAREVVLPDFPEGMKQDLIQSLLAYVFSNEFIPVKQ